jgi:hypothetical protein
MPSSSSRSYLPSANPSPLFQQQQKQPIHKAVNDQDDNDNQPLNKLLRGGAKISNKSLKLQELKRLSYKYCCPNDANTILLVVNLQWTLDRNEDFLDATLAQLRDMDRVRSDDYSSF